jgi:hypothetical protein
MTTKYVILLCLLTVACGNDPGNTQGLDGAAAIDGGNPTTDALIVDPGAACDAVHAAYNRLETMCSRPIDSLYNSIAGNPADCRTVTQVTRPEDVSICVSWLAFPAGSCGELHNNPGDPPWTPTANCLDLFQ